MDIIGNLDFKGLGKLIRPGIMVTDFPSNPKVGEFILKDRKLFVCVDILNGLPFWVNLVNELSMYRHDQKVGALEWTVNHNLNTNINVVQVYDANGLQVVPDAINSSVLNQTTISFSYPMTGTALISSGDLLGVPRSNTAYTETFEAATTWVVVHGLGYNPNITCIVNSYVVQPLTIVHDSALQATITFSSAQSGSVRCV